MSDTDFYEEAIAKRAAETGRKCGSCSMCCYVLSIDWPEIQKAPDTWCEHCPTGKGGCAIYDARPPVCRAFACRWLVDSSIPDYFQPQKSKIVAHLVANPGFPPVLIFAVDRRFPNRWREDRYYSIIQGAARAAVIMGRRDPTKFYFTKLEVGDDAFMIPPDGEPMHVPLSAEVWTASRVRFSPPRTGRKCWYGSIAEKTTTVPRYEPPYQMASEMKEVPVPQPYHAVRPRP